MPFIAAAPTTLALSGVGDGAIAQLANLKPDFSSGDAVHAHYVNAVAGALPGHYSQLIGTGKAFRKIFYPHYKQQPPEDKIQGDTGLSGSWWSNFSVAILCQIIARNTRNARKNIKSGKVDGDVASYNATLNARSAKFYSRVLGEFAPIKSILASLNMSTAKAQYRQALIDNIAVRQLWYANGLWDSPDWEMYNHYAKYMILGASEAEVDSLIDALTAGGLPIPGIVNKASWRGYSQFLLNHPKIDQTALAHAASGGVHETTLMPNYGGGMPGQLPEGNCYEFIASSQPGSKYWKSPSNSCFSADTQVIMSDGSAKAISTVAAGEKVAGPEGPLTVLSPSAPALGSRPLYRIDPAKGPAFTATHPFRNGSAGPQTLAADPNDLRDLIPPINAAGVGTLEAGSVLSSRAADGSVQPYTVDAVTSSAGTTGEVVYDLLLSFAEPGAKGYWAGGGGLFVRTRPEIALISEAPEVAIAVAAILKAVAASGVPGFDANSGPQDLDAFRTWMRTYGSAVFHNALRDALASHGGGQADAAPPPDPAAEIDAIIQATAGTRTVAAAALGVLAERLIDDASSALEAAIAMGWRKFGGLGGDLISISIYDLNLTGASDAGESLALEMTIPSTADDTPRNVVLDRPAQSTPFRRIYRRLAHFQAVSGAPSPSIRLSLRHQGGGPSLASGALSAIEADADYQLRAVALTDATGAVYGRLEFDIRRVDADFLSAEADLSAGWTDADLGSFAHVIGQSMGPMILKGIEKRG
ncbi:MAG: hypothetical protein AAFN79_21300 [Pseudomonadota bacterium]